LGKMAPSQLKQLKSSLRDHGISGPSQSKKARKSDQSRSKKGHKEAVLSTLRESFNPFELKSAVRPRKFDVTSSKTIGQNGKAVVLGRPGVTKSRGEELRRNTLLPDLHRRGKVGGIQDRRIGEMDRTLTPEERLQQRLAKEATRRRGKTMFDLDEDEDTIGLTHLGKDLDDFEEDISDASEDEARGENDYSDDDREDGASRKRRWEGDGAASDVEDGAEPERKKSKAEVMKEVIAKSKFHKFERQQAKEEDHEIREKLDKETQGILALLGKGKPGAPKAGLPPAPANGISKDAGGETAAEKRRDYDEDRGKLLFDQRAKPTERTKTVEELEQARVDRLKAMDEERARRMRGEADDSAEKLKSDEDGDAEFFGFQSSKIPEEDRMPGEEQTDELGFEDEDDFLIEDDLVASDMEGSVAEYSSDEESEDESTTFAGDDIVNPNRTALGSGRKAEQHIDFGPEHAGSYPCPQSHEEFLTILEPTTMDELPSVIQKIRAAYGAQLRPENVEKLSAFSTVLVDHIAYLGTLQPPAPLPVVETVIRHIHSLARSSPLAVSKTFRTHLRRIQTTSDLAPGDLFLLTAISTIYPTSDHFHQVATPAISLIGRWLGLHTAKTPSESLTGAYLVALALRYLRLSARYMPELLRFSTSALRHRPAPTLAAAHVANLLTMAELWSGTPGAFPAMFPSSILPLLDPTSAHRLRVLLANARRGRRPLELHHHRPLAIRSVQPKFEENYNPDKHYDPDAGRTESKKLAKEYKRERKGAMRELRKDANFVAREQLKEKKAKDAAYEVKYRKLVAEINEEGGRGRNEYDRERRKAGRGR
ncbi:Nop14-like protein, partial [Eremomyces bilateralis CBS 781.70]